jgi:hypothetical protein
MPRPEDLAAYLNEAILTQPPKTSNEMGWGSLTQGQTSDALEGLSG